MELQQRKYSCGPSALRAALYVLGHNVLEATIRKWANTNSEGTDEKGIIRAIKHYDHRAREYQSKNTKQSWNWLKAALSKGKPVLLCVDEWNHWMAAVGRLGGKVLVFDPEQEPGKRRRYSGLKLYNEQDLAARWCYTETSDGDSGCYYAIAIS